MAKFEVTNKSNIRKHCYGVQIEPGETKQLDILVKEADEIPSYSFHVERVDQDDESQEEEEPEEEPAVEQNQVEDSVSVETDSGGE